ncbi:SIMPL domain-containing protein [Pseudomonadota bacterium]
MMRKVITTLLLFALPGATFAAPELSGSPQELSNYLIDQKKIIVISASAEKKLEADQAEVALIVKTEDRSLDKALSSNEQLRESIRKQLQNDGVSANNIKSSKFSSTPSYGWFKEKPKSYEIDNEMKIIINSESQLRSIAKIVDNESQVFLGTTEFKDSNKESNELNTLEMALNKVNAKKAVYEKQLSISLTPVRVIDQRVYTSRPQKNTSTRRLEKMRSTNSSLSISAEPVAAPQATGFGSVNYSAHASVEYMLVTQ